MKSFISTSPKNLSISKSYPYPQESNHISGEFDDMLTDLVNAEVDGYHVLGIYADIRRGMYSTPDILCHKYIGTEHGCVACAENVSDDPRTAFFMKAVLIMRATPVMRFMQQYHASILRSANDSGVENGYLYESFLESLPSNTHAVFLDPPPHFIQKLLEDIRYAKRKITVFHSDTRIDAIYQADSEIQTLFQSLTGESVHALVFADYSASSGIAAHLAELHRRTAVAKRLAIHLYLPNSLVDGMSHRKATHEYLLSEYTITGIRTIEASAFQTSKKRHSIIVLHDKSAIQGMIPMGIIRHSLEGGCPLMTAEAPVNIDASLFHDGYRSISALISDAIPPLAATAKIESSEDALAKSNSLRFEFSPEIIGFATMLREQYHGKPRYRLKMNMYGKPNSRQLLENDRGRGSALMKSGVKGNWKKTEAAAVACAFEFLDRENIRKAVCSDLESRVNDSDFSLLSFWYLHRHAIEGKDKREARYARNFFFHPEEAWSACKSLPVHNCTGDDIKMMVSKAVDANETVSSIRKRVNLLRRIFAIDVKAGKREENPCDAVYDELTQTINDRREFRDAIGIRSQTDLQNRMMFENLLSMKGTNEYGLAIGGLICMLTGIDVSEVCALNWECLFPMESVNIYQFVINWKYSEYETGKKHRIRRCIPLCDLLCDALLEWKEYQSSLPGVSSEDTQPIVTRTENGVQVPISRKVMSAFLRKQIDKLGIQPQNIPIPTEDGTMMEYDISRYHGPWFRMNFNYYARIAAKMPPDDLNYILGRKLQSTDARHYRDYQKDLRQLALKVMLDRWTAQLRLGTEDIDTSMYRLSISKKSTIAFEGHAVPTQHFIRLTTPVGKSGESIRVIANARYGLKSKVNQQKEAA